MRWRGKYFCDIFGKTSRFALGETRGFRSSVGGDVPDVPPTNDYRSGKRKGSLIPSPQLGTSSCRKLRTTECLFNGANFLRKWKLAHFGGGAGASLRACGIAQSAIPLIAIESRTVAHAKLPFSRAAFF